MKLNRLTCPVRLARLALALLGLGLLVPGIARADLTYRDRKGPVVGGISIQALGVPPCATGGTAGQRCPAAPAP